MDFGDNEAEAAFRAEAHSWLAENARELGPGERKKTLPEYRRDHDFVEAAKKWQAVKASGGWACLTWPQEYGGRGATPIENIIWNQEEARFDTAPNIFTIGQGMLGPTMMVHGSAEQKERYLPAMLRGEEVWCQLFSEPGAGSDLAGLQTRAERDGDDWVVNGQKIWTSGAQYCDFGMIVTRTDPSAQKHAGLTYFIVDMRSPGIEIRPIQQINGTSGFNEVFFTDVRIPDRNRLGEVNDGWRGALTTLMNERQTLGGGGAGPSLRDLMGLARKVSRGGRPAIEDPGVRARLADFYVREKGIQFTHYRSLSAVSRGETPGPQASTGKMIGAPLRQEMASFALDLLGQGGSVIEGELADTWAQAYLAAPGIRIAGGSDEILRNIVSERVLGLPPEPRVDKGLAFKDIPKGRGSE